MRYYQAKIDPLIQKRQLNNSEPLNDAQLGRMMSKLNSFKTESERLHSLKKYSMSVNKTNFDQRDTKKLQNYQKY